MRRVLTAPAVAAAPGVRGDRAYALDPRVALRPEPFGALAYHCGNRRLTFLRAPELVALVKDLEHHRTVDDALAASSIAASRWSAFRAALSALVESEVIRER
ncbi:MAG: mycofactocin biosynthesis chaperone MftB [Acidimicrobiales bacterium]